MRFLGAAGTVTGSRYLVNTPAGAVLVDAGLFQGRKELRRRNWEPFPVPPAALAAVVLTHAHIDHAGALPLLAREGYRGPVHCTPATRDLASLLLPDSGKLPLAAVRDRLTAQGFCAAVPRHGEEVELG